MTKNLIKTILITAIILILFGFDLPTGWHKAGSHPKSYHMGIDKGSAQDGKNSATIKSNDKKINGFGTLMQSCLPTKYLGKRVKMSGYMKTKDVAGWSGFWFRVDQADSDKTLSFDNMQNRSITGTTDWKEYEIILDVPLKSSNLAYGALLSGTGQIWFSNIKFEIVDSSVPTTDNSKNIMPLTEPTNLNFEK